MDDFDNTLKKLSTQVGQFTDTNTSALPMRSLSIPTSTGASGFGITSNLTNSPYKYTILIPLCVLVMLLICKPTFVMYQDDENTVRTGLNVKKVAVTVCIVFILVLSVTFLKLSR